VCAFGVPYVSIATPTSVLSCIPILTLSQWGLIILAMLLAVFGYVALKQESTGLSYVRE
jgi:hypothetical protein